MIAGIFYSVGSGFVLLNTTPLPVEVGAFATVSAGFLWCLHWMTSKMSAELKEQTKTLVILNLSQLETYRLLMMHDSQIRGVNPSAGKDSTEAHTKALSEYQRILAQLNATTEIIKSILSK